MHKKIVQRDTDDNESLSSSTEEIKERKKKRKRQRKVRKREWTVCPLRSANHGLLRITEHLRKI